MRSSSPSLWGGKDYPSRSRLVKHPWEELRLSIQTNKSFQTLISWFKTIIPVIVKATNGPRYVVGCRRQLDKNKLKGGTRVALDMTTLTIMRHLPREVIIVILCLHFT